MQSDTPNISLGTCTSFPIASVSTLHMPDPLTRRRSLLLRKWTRWVETVYSELVHLADNRQIFRDTQAVAKNNPVINKENAFWEFILTSYTTHASLAVRRQLDRDRRSVSLRLLLEDILEHPQALTRRRLLCLLTRYGMPKKYANDLIDRTKKMGRVHISPKAVRHDIICLKRTCGKIQRFVNKTAAHNSKHPLRSLPTFSDLDKAIDCIESIFKPYVFLVKRNGVRRFAPVHTEDWKWIFDVPWRLRA